MVLAKLRWKIKACLKARPCKKISTKSDLYFYDFHLWKLECLQPHSIHAESKKVQAKKLYALIERNVFVLNKNSFLQLFKNVKQQF